MESCSLRKYIESKSLLKEFELNNTNLVIDGDTISRELYKIITIYKKGHPQGDYNIYADYVESFFRMLCDCHITPYVVFEGGIQDPKIKSKIVSYRLKKIIDCFSISCITNDEQYFPLLMRNVFEYILKKLNIKMVRCDFESFSEVLSIARSLNCPVLSSDPKYFFCTEIVYITFQSLCETEKVPNSNIFRFVTKNNPEISHIACAAFDINGFLKHLELTSDKLPLVVAILATDGSEYPNYASLYPEAPYSPELLLKISSCIRDRSVEGAIHEFLNVAETTADREKLQQKIESFKCVTRCYKSKYSSYLEICNNHDFPEYELDLQYDGQMSEIPDIFLENFRKCRYSPYLMDMYIHNQYFGLKPQLEEINSTHSHSFSENIVNAIHKILTNSISNLTCFVRNGESMVEKVFPLSEIDAPSFTEIQDMNIEDRKLLMLEILEVQSKKDSILWFPEHYQLFITSLLYMQNQSSPPILFCYSLIICAIILDINQKCFFCNFDIIPIYNMNLNSPTMQDAENREQSLIAREVKYFSQYFESKEIVFDKDLMHCMSQFQSCLLHINLLNDVLNMPFSEFPIVEYLNSTFILNFYKEMEKRSDPHVDTFIRYLFAVAPEIITKFLEMNNKLS